MFVRAQRFLENLFVETFGEVLSLCNSITLKVSQNNLLMMKASKVGENMRDEVAQITQGQSILEPQSSWFKCLESLADPTQNGC